MFVRFQIKFTKNNFFFSDWLGMLDNFLEKIKDIFLCKIMEEGGGRD